jgi:uncharacterized protein (DUF1697 family)
LAQSKLKIALLRGVNISGTNKVGMKELCKSLEKVGYKNVRSYINSGNLIFESEKDADSIEKTISKTIVNKFEVKTPVLVLTFDLLDKIYRENPFNDNRYQPNLVHIIFIKDTTKLKLFKDKIQTEDLYQIGTHAIYLYTPDGYHKTKINNLFWEKRLNTLATARNLNTVTKLTQMLN